MDKIDQLNEIIIKANYPEARNIERLGDYLPVTFSQGFQLAQVLKALNKEFKSEYHKIIFQNNKLLFICSRDEAVQVYWDFEKSLEGQDKETINRLYILLKDD